MQPFWTDWHTDADGANARSWLHARPTKAGKVEDQKCTSTEPGSSPATIPAVAPVGVSREAVIGDAPRRSGPGWHHHYYHRPYYVDASRAGRRCGYEADQPDGAQECRKLASHLSYPGAAAAPPPPAEQGQRSLKSTTTRRNHQRVSQQPVELRRVVRFFNGRCRCWDSQAGNRVRETGKVLLFALRLLLPPNARAATRSLP